MPVSNAKASWEGDLKSGNGTMGITGYEGAFTYASRFESADATNPEELIGAANAGCFTLSLAAKLSAAGHVPDRVSTDAKVHLEKVGDAFSITRIELTTQAKVSGIDDEAFQAIAKDAKETCIISRTLSTVDISLDASLVN